MSVRAIRGATTVIENSRESILKDTKELLLAMQETNNFNTEDIICIFFSMTSDLDAAFPAEAARQLGWNTVPLFGMQEADVRNSLEKCIRILLQLNSNKVQADFQHCYLKKAKSLRKDLNYKEERKDKKWC
ncbi:MAG: chorismate mutase [Candidatus Caldatribacteriota bacterium]|nr:chorismate mutase [Atribacterota bacterium]MDD3640759.1 chorismate mutase [Atribacterota bacterium]MDD4289292.1 chorismate mutase [Atribacterota bacterium]MDD4765806.1 chorismate mutase [Atribacterota bacterium]